MKLLKNATLLLMVMALPACRTAQQTSYVHKNADLGAITKVAVLPFDNLSQERTAGDKVQKVFYLELLALDVFEVAEPGQVTKVMRAQASADALAPADYQKIGKDLGVDAIFIGSVVDYTETRTGSTPTPEVTIQLRLIEAHSGSTVWSTGRTRSGASVSTRLFGVGGESMTQAARRVVRAELGTLLK
jgi:TolB-like protein